MNNLALGLLVLRALILLLVSSAALIRPVGAHEVLPSVADVVITPDGISVRIELSLETLLSGIDASVYSDTNDAPQAGEYDRLRAMDPGALGGLLTAQWSETSSVFVVEGVAESGAWVLTGQTIPPVDDIELVRISVLEFAKDLPGDAPISFGARAALGPLVVRHVNAGEDGFRGYLEAGERTPPLPRIGGSAENMAQTFVRYVVLGVEHIVPKGLDHILFVLGLFFFALAWRPLLWQITTFTLAHTTTLALASLGLVSVPASIVEPLIAASIVYVAFENLRGVGVLNRLRIGVVFGFGLLHGLGFASVLSDIGLGQGQFVVGLIGFNIGVEVGQLLVILVAFLVVGIWFGRREYYRPWIAMPASLAIGATGAYWVVERVFF